MHNTVDCTLSTTTDTSAFQTLVKPETPRAGASTADRKAYLDYQLDSLMHRSVLVVLRFLSGPSYRLSGGVAGFLCQFRPASRVSAFPGGTVTVALSFGRR